MQIIDLEQHPINDLAYRQKCKSILDADGAVVLDGFLMPEALEAVRDEGQAKMEQAYFCASNHNVYLEPIDSAFESDHPRNVEVVSSKGLIAHDQISDNCPLKQIYGDTEFTRFISHVVGEPANYPYADALSGVNLHFAKTGQELGWHFDNSSFATTLLIEKPEAGGVFEYVRDVRDADRGDMNFDAVGDILGDRVRASVLEAEPGTLILFRGRNSMHRVTPTIGDKTRMLAVLAYNSKAGVSLSDSARKTFYGRQL